MSKVTKGRLLVLEDDPNLLVGLRDILELDNYQVVTAENGKQGLDILNHDPYTPDLILSDIMMPMMDGMEFLRHVRRQDRFVKIPVIFLTAKDEKTDIQQGKVLGVDDYLVKPFEAQDLLIAIAAKLDRHRRINQAQEGAVAEIKRHLLTILNHEFRTPLTLVVAYADMLKEYELEQMSPGELVSFLKGVNSGAERLRRLIENFILLVELETGDLAHTYEWRKSEIYDLSDIIRAAHQHALREETRHRRVSFNLNAPSVQLIGDAEYLMVAVRELIDNAIKFSAPHQPVIVETYLDGKWVCIEVIDYGRGIPNDELGKIWQPFYQIRRDLYEDQGTGTGLALVAGIMEIHQGEALVESVEHQGSRFTLKLPIVTEHQDRSEPRRVTEAASR
jgi:signal transduction histidine kinase